MPVKGFQNSMSWAYPTVLKKSLTEREFQIDFYSHVVHEERMVCSSWYDANFDAILWIPVQELIIDKHLVTHASPHCENCATAPEGTKWYSILIWIRKKRVIAIRTWIRKKASTSTQLFTEYRRENWRSVKVVKSLKHLIGDLQWLQLPSQENLGSPLLSHDSPRMSSHPFQC
jgi:hypothetical protein